jgi:hypothetical protein
MWLIGITTCASDEHPLPGGGGGGNSVVDTLSVPIQVPFTKAPNDNLPENRIVSARIIVIKQDRVTNNRILNGIDISESNIQITDLVPVGYVDFFVIVNELVAWNLDDIHIGDIYFSNNLKQKIVTYNAGYPVVDATHPIPMFKMYENLQITENASTLLNNAPVALSSVERLYAKVSLELDCTFANLANGGDPIEIKQVSIKSMPKESYLAPTSYTKTGASDFFDGSTLTASNYTWTATGFESDFLCYIPEYLVSDISRNTYISAIVNLVADANSEREYKIVLGDSITKGNAYMLGNTKLYSDVRISRNTHYHFAGNIKSFDIRAEEDIELRPKILAWEETAVDSVIFQKYNLDVSQDLFQLSQVPFDGVINVDTDHPKGWSAVPVSSGNHTTLIGGPYTGKSSGVLKFHYDGQAIIGADTIKVTAGNVTKKILVKN